MTPEEIKEARRHFRMIYEIVTAGRRLIHDHSHLLKGRKPKLIIKLNQ